MKRGTTISLDMMIKAMVVARLTKSKETTMIDREEKMLALKKMRIIKKASTMDRKDLAIMSLTVLITTSS